MSTVAILAALKAGLWLPLLYVGIRHRSIPSVAVVYGAWVALALNGSGHIVASAAVGAAVIPFIVVLLIDRLYQRPEHVQRVAAEQVRAARQEMHDTINDALASHARDTARRDRRIGELEQHLRDS